MADDGTPSDVDHYVYSDGGRTRTAYDSAGNRMYTESGTDVQSDYGIYGGTTERVDEQTGETYTYEQPATEFDSNRAGWDRRRERRGNRQARRKEEEAGREARVDYYGGNANEAIGGIGDPWADLEGHIPTYEELMGDEYVSTMADASADPMAVEAQRAALLRMGQVARSGYTAEDRAVEQKARSNAAQFERQQRDALMQQAASRGMQGAGTTLSAQLQAQQAGANRNSQASVDMAANAQRRALRALQMQSGAAGQMRGQSFGEDAARRSAVDEANRYMTDGQRSASRDQFAARGQVAQGQSGAAAQQAEQNRLMMENAQGQQTTTEKRNSQVSEYVTGLIG